MPPLDAGAVDQNVDLVASGGDVLGDVCDLLLHGKISCEDPCFATSLFDGLFCRCRRGVSLCQLCQLKLSFYLATPLSLLSSILITVSFSLHNSIQPLISHNQPISLTWIKIMSAPASASPMATAWPMPRVAPVMRAVEPSRENMEAIF